MKYFFTLLIGLLAWGSSQAQSPTIAFNQAANLFIEGQNQEALQAVNAGLKRHPNNNQLKALKAKLEEQQKQQEQQQQQQNQNQEKQEQEKGDSEQEQKSQEQEGQEQEEKEGNEKKEQQEGQEGEEEKPEEKEGEGQEEQNQPQPGQSETEQRLKEMDISPEKARMILEAMKSNEVQYLQQKKRKNSRRSDSGKPDW